MRAGKYSVTEGFLEGFIREGYCWFCVESAVIEKFDYKALFRENFNWLFV